MSEYDPFTALPPRFPPERRVLVRYTRDDAFSVPNNSETTMDFDDLDINTCPGCVVTGASWLFTSPRMMYCIVGGMVTFESTAWDAAELGYLAVRVNGVLKAFIGRETTDTTVTKKVTVSGTDIPLLVKRGDTIDFRVYQNTGGAINTDNSALRVHCHIIELPYY